MKHAATIGRLAYIGIIAFATIAEPTVAPLAAVARLGHALDPSVSGRDIVDALRNVLLFAGWGAVWAITAPVGRAWPIILRATGAGLLVSAAVEAAQLLAPSRTPSVLDVVTNTTGAFAGAFATAVLIVLLRAARGQRSYVGMPMLLFAVGYGGAVMAEAFSPLFRQDRIPGLWGGPFERLSVTLRNVSMSMGAFSFLDVLLFAPAGFLAAAAFAEPGTTYRRAAAYVAGGGLFLSIALEAARGAAGFTIEAAAMAAHAIAIAAGAAAAVRIVPWFTRIARGAVRPFAVFWIYTSILALWYLRPFSPEVDGAMIAMKLPIERFIPLQAYRERMDVFSAADAVIPVLQLVPLGALLGVWPMRRRGPLSGILPGVYAVVALELLQIVIAGRFFDITDALIGIAALALGLAAIRRAGYRPYGEMLSVNLSGAPPPRTAAR